MADGSPEQTGALAGVIGLMGAIVGALINGMFKRTDSAPNGNGSKTVPLAVFEARERNIDRLLADLHTLTNLQEAAAVEAVATRRALTSLARAFHRLSRVLEDHVAMVKDG